MPKRIYTLYEAMEAVGRAAHKGKPRSYIWVETAQGPCKFLKPYLTMTGLGGDVEVRVTPRYQVRAGN